MLPTFDAELVKALSQSGVAVLMLIVVLIVVWGATKVVALVREISASFHDDMASARGEFQESQDQARREYQAQIKELNEENRAVIVDVTRSVKDLDITVRDVSRTVSGLDATVQRLDRSLLTIQENIRPRTT